MLPPKNTESSSPNHSAKTSRVEKLFWVTGWIYDFSKVATVILIIGLLIHYFFFTILIVRGQSMMPNFVDGEVMTINKIGYRLASPQRGDVVAMNWPGETEKRFIKRIVGLPGETITITAGSVAINGRVLTESYLDPSIQTSSDTERTLQSDEYFVLGDNRSVSSDSRAWGPVPRSFIIGKIGPELLKLPATATN